LKLILEFLKALFKLALGGEDLLLFEVWSGIGCIGLIDVHHVALARE